MKSLVFALAVLTAPLQLLACPGGHLKTLAVNGRQLAELDMTDSSIRLTEPTAKIISISTIKSNSYETYEQCGHSNECESSQLLAIDVLEDPQAIVIVHIREAKEVSSSVFKITNFSQARSACGQVLKPLE